MALPLLAVTENSSSREDVNCSLIVVVSAEKIVTPSFETVRFP